MLDDPPFQVSRYASQAGAHGRSEKIEMPATAGADCANSCCHCCHARGRKWVAESAGSAETPTDAHFIGVFRGMRWLAESSGK